MSREKQIEEMAKLIHEAENNRCHHRSCLECKYGNNDDPLCTEKITAEYLCDEGYRKQSEGEWIFEHEFYGKMFCSNCKEEALVNECSEYVDSDFCPNCGAKMKGGAE